MKKYMVVFLADGNETVANFFDTYTEAKNAYMDMECGLGWYAEIYERMEIEEEGYKEKEYRLIES